MFSGDYKSTKSTAYRTISLLEQTIGQRRVALQDGGPRLIFLCGANKLDQTLSERRVALRAFIQTHVPNSHVIIAEDFFRARLQHPKRGKRARNLFDIEKDLSDISDHILIVLEGEGAFCELGAFSHEELRKKLLIVNNSAHAQSNSFINLGPIAAIEAATPYPSVAWYPMEPHGKEEGDGIALTFPLLIRAIKKTGSSRTKKIGKDALDPSMGPSKVRLLFLHDLIRIAGPITYPSLIDLLKILFGEEKRFDPVRESVALLISLGLIEYEHPGPIKSKTDHLFLDFGEDPHELQMKFAMIRMRDACRGES
ncbi:retron St85 family effector protein [Thioalkalivibrio sp. ALJ1]|uniref:retron St85 family effector protein n=1 Tax=Thioalkalivibrio sp. ALJ1 TaxID=1158144 RepID=UPI000571A1EC|nr:retron St85 family effector protein [Thioalkalivibrio sp. ALJ1]